MKILAIEDNPADAEILCELFDLQGSSFELRNANSLSAAGEVLSRGDTEFVLLDLGLPDSQGIDTLRTVRSRHPSLPIVVLTGFDDEEAGMLALHEGAQDYLIKGQITGPALVRTIRYAYERNRIEQELKQKNQDLDAVNSQLSAIQEELQRANTELLNSNMRLNALNQELSAAQEELFHNIEELSRREEDLKRSESELKTALAEKDILLSEVHHRVKNNLTAFISLLSLEGSHEDSPAGRALKMDLQNRARSMALIHETLYRTRQFSKVDMEVYLNTLVEQVVKSFTITKPVKVDVDAKGIWLDIPRAIPAGLIINELLTNVFKYAFPDSINTKDFRGAPPTITIAISKSDGKYELTVKDNGIGLPPAMDITSTKTLGLKLVNFLAKHQMRADAEVKSDNGTEFIFRFGE